MKNMQDKMTFVNGLSKQQKYSMIRALDFNRPRKYYNKDDRMKNFLLNWFINGEENLVKCVSKDSILYA